jgi:hypothetical protein
LGELGLFHVPLEDNELLAQQRVFKDKISAAAGHIGEDAGDEHNGSRLRPLFDGLFQPVAELFLSIEDSSDHTIIGSK